MALEAGLPQSLRQALAQRGHRLLDGEPAWSYGGAQLIWRLEQGYLGASDPRKDGQAGGFEKSDAWQVTKMTKIKDLGRLLL